MINLKQRLSAACQTNDTQAISVLVMSVLQLAACFYRESCPWWLFVLAGGFWPVFAFVSNFYNPIRKN